MPTKKISKQTYTITEAAKKLKVTRAAIHRAIQDKRLNAQWGEKARVVKALIISEEDLKAFQVDVEQQSRGKKRSK